MKIVFTIFFAFIFNNCFLSQQGYIEAGKIAGFRASRILSSYPNNQFPQPGYWIGAGNFISGKFSDSQPTSIWIVSLYLSGGQTQLNFPNPGGSYPNISFISADQNETYLNNFDQAGIKVYLQVEPGAASIDTLIHIVLNKYKHHSCVVGFGIDVEWYNTQTYSGGKKVTDAEAQRWEQKVKSIKPEYNLFLKHYGQAWMPPLYRGEILFVDDSQEFTSFNSMVNEFKLWGNKFKPNKVAFQFGYPKDKPWWIIMNDPVKTIGDALFSNISNCSGVFWVDFTINQVYPLTAIEEEITTAEKFILYPSYPNPFNPSTTISFYIPALSKVKISVFDIKGKEIEIISNKEYIQGNYSIVFDAKNLSSGVYFVNYEYSGDDKKTSKMTQKLLLLK